MIKVLLVEDEALHLMYLKRLFQVSGFEVTGAVASATMAMESVNNQVPDVAVFDINLNNTLDGIELASKLREKFSFPIVFVSGYDDPVTAARRSKIAQSLSLSKPVAENKLMEAIHQLLEDQTLT